MEKEQKKSKSFSEIAASITQIIKKPLSKEEAQKINSIIQNEENTNKDEKKPKVAKPQDPEANV